MTPRTPNSPMNALRAVAVFAVVVLWTIVLLPGQLYGIATGARFVERIPLLYHRVASRLLRLSVVQLGAAVERRPVLFICNHISWLDIVVLGRLLPVSFIAKREVASWPFFGHLAKLQRSVFIDRTWRAAAGQRDEIQRRLEAGDNLVLFGEGTSGDGVRVLPFKSALLAVAERRIDGRPLTVQPLTITYTRLDGMPMLRGLMPRLAWYGGMDLVPHFWGVLTGGPVTAEVRLHEPVTIEQFGSRKQLSAYCQRRVQEGMNAALTGRPHGAGRPLPPAAGAES